MQLQNELNLQPRFMFNGESSTYFTHYCSHLGSVLVKDLGSDEAELQLIRG